MCSYKKVTRKLLFEKKRLLPPKKIEEILLYLYG